MLSNHFLRHASACCRVTTQHMLYHSRAHPKPIPEIAVTDALSSLLKDVNGRKRLRSRRFKRRGVETTVEHPDETIELAVNLNLDPRKPGQALRGSISLPNGTGKKQMDCLVFTSDPALQEAALQAGAKYAGGEGLADEVVAGRVAVDTIQRSLATAEILPIISKKVARLLGPRGLMPNAKEGTLLQGSAELLEALETQLAGKQVPYRTEKEGIVHVPVGKGSFGKAKLLENIGQVMKTIFDVKPENYGKGKKKKTTGKGTKYLLRASVSSTQGKGVRLDLRTVDPNSTFFLTSPEEVAKAALVPDAQG
ncbi:large subunit ribosomal protein L1 [Fistulifera solaris]|uniref:Large subunit ribosomal protein L1 n=1 Tax=Fistulifera solaris TaxID=1519565 RepID=A0A1Z5KJW7_FISSO|nr:large subunit ribosomal protein L1 [Fistulifera solaris]|eukprot:GAX26372.1 large subunit ribosomal protein L1 [Fistulifera solaris]